MDRLALAAAALAAMAVLFVVPASAQSRLALVIGNSAYTAPPLSTTIADATLIAKTAKRNIEDWHAAFNIAPDDSMYIPPEKRVHIW